MNTRPTNLRVATRNARRLLHGCTDQANARRIVRLMRHPDAGMVHARHLAAMLPSIVRAEAESVRAAAFELDLDGTDRITEKEWRTYLQKADTLFGWADQCAFESTQRDALAALEKLMTEKLTA